MCGTTSSVYAPLSTGNDSGARQFRQRMWYAAIVCALLLAAIFFHNYFFYSSLRPLVDELVAMEDTVLKAQQDVQGNVNQLLHNIR